MEKSLQFFVTHRLRKKGNPIKGKEKRAVRNEGGKPGMSNIMETGEKELAWEKPQRKPIDSTGHRSPGEFRHRRLEPGCKGQREGASVAGALQTSVYARTGGQTGPSSPTGNLAPWTPE